MQTNKKPYKQQQLYIPPPLQKKISLETSARQSVKLISLANEASFNVDSSGLSPVSVKQWDSLPEFSSPRIKAELKQRLNDFPHLNT